MPGPLLRSAPKAKQALRACFAWNETTGLLGLRALLAPPESVLTLNPWPSEAKASPRLFRSRAQRWRVSIPSGCAEERRRRRDKGRSCLSAT